MVYRFEQIEDGGGAMGYIEFNDQHDHKIEDDDITGVRHEIAGVYNGNNIFDGKFDDTKSYNDIINEQNNDSDEDNYKNNGKHGDDHDKEKITKMKM